MTTMTTTNGFPPQALRMGGQMPKGMPMKGMPNAVQRSSGQSVSVSKAVGSSKRSVKSSSRMSSKSR